MGVGAGGGRWEEADGVGACDGADLQSSHGEGEQAATVTSVVPSSSRAAACPAETGKPEPRGGKRPAPPTSTLSKHSAYSWAKV